MLECAAHTVQLVQCRIFCICQLRNQPRNPDFAFWGTETFKLGTSLASHKTCDRNLTFVQLLQYNYLDVSKTANELQRLTKRMQGLRTVGSKD
jgi:hypothetical protein